MDFSNKAGVRRLRIILLVIGICWLMVMVVFIFFEMFTALAISASLFLVFALLITLMNYQYVKIAVADNKLIVRYYSIFSVDRIFQMFEFPILQLRNVEVHKYFFGLKWNVRFTIRVQKGLADYPPISLSGIPFRDRSRLVMELMKLVPKK
jgi:hypothetical protein